MTCRGALLLPILILLAGCPDPERPSFPSVPDGDDDDVVGDDDDSTGDDDDSTGDDDDATDPDPCGEFLVSADAPPVWDHGGDVGEVTWLFPAGCGTAGEMQELFGGWVDGDGNGLDVSATLAGSLYGTMEEAVGRMMPVDAVEPFVAELDLGNRRFLPPTEMGGVYIAYFEDNVRWEACFYGHGGTWTEEEGTATVEVPDPLQFVCE